MSATQYVMGRDANGSAIQGPRLFSTATVALSGASNYKSFTPPDGAIFVRLSSPDDSFFVSASNSGGFLAVSQEASGIPVVPGVALYVGSTAAASGTVNVYALYDII